MKINLINYKIFLLIFLAPSLSLANSKCFIAMEDAKIIQQIGDCKTRHSPCSTFKIAISLMGYDSNILTDENNPNFTFKTEYGEYPEIRKGVHDPRTWMKYSIVWYSQIITQKLGKQKFASYIKKFNYGNQDISGDFGKNNGLTESWLGSSLKISPYEQIQFLQQLLDGKLKISSKSQQITTNILFNENLLDDWQIYGKTGSCNSEDNKKQSGWFVGWIQKEKRKIIFANYLEDDKNLNYSGGKLAKDESRIRLTELITNQ